MIKATFLYLIFSIIVFSGVSISLQKSTEIDCKTMGKQSLACKQLEKKTLINKLLK
tara:strand:- start:170 stop:337 length:168 start_codon:yes stop_codon:yes gene_type:complete